MNKIIINKSLFVSIALISGCSYINNENIRTASYLPEIQPFKELKIDYTHIAHEDRFPFTGGAVLDVDNDGKMEIFISGSKGQLNGVFTYKNGEMLNITEHTGIVSTESSYGATSIDIDNDGDTDLLLAQYSGVWLYINNKGRFTGKKLNLDLPYGSFPLNIAVTDLNKDGLPDLYISNFIIPELFKAATFNNPDHAKSNLMLLNKGKLGFEDITEQTGTAGLQNTFHSTFVDLDGNGHQDLVLANNTGNVEIFKNKGNLQFEKQDIDTGFGFWMGLGVGDINKDGYQDLFFTNSGSSIPESLLTGDLKEDQKINPEWLLLTNDGNWNFTDSTSQYLLNGYGFAWGGVFEDLNLDAELDLLVAQNYLKWPLHKLGKLSGKAFLQLSQSVEDGFYHIDALELNNAYYGQTNLIADLNSDGKPDVVWINMDGPVRVFINQSSNNFLKVRLPDNAKYLGAELWLELDNGKSYTRQVVANVGMASDQTASVFFGLGQQASIRALHVKLADGTRQVINNPASNKTILLD